MSFAIIPTIFFSIIRAIALAGACIYLLAATLGAFFFLPAPFWVQAGLAFGALLLSFISLILIFRVCNRKSSFLSPMWLAGAIFFGFYVGIVGMFAYNVNQHQCTLSSLVRKAALKLNALNNANLRQGADDKNMPSKSSLMWTYARLIARDTVYNRMGHAALKEDIFGNTIAFNRYGNLVLLFEEIFVHKDYGVKFSTPSPQIIDCGSNIGLSILFFKMVAPTSSVLAFEAEPKTFSLLSENVKQNKLSNVTLVNKALADKEGEVKFYSTEPGGLTNSLEEQEGSAQTIYTVQATRLSPYIDGPIDLVKIDIEGAELAVLKDLEKNGKLKLVKQFIIEYHHEDKTGKAGLGLLLNMFEQNGFQIQVSTSLRPPFKKHQSQNILIFAYQDTTQQSN